ncbi:hypothetical protein GCK32_004473, partial [Trichostrongylus colubriformis]
MAALATDWIVTEKKLKNTGKMLKLKLTDLSQMPVYDPSQELIFPPELRV